MIVNKVWQYELFTVDKKLRRIDAFFIKKNVIFL